MYITFFWTARTTITVPPVAQTVNVNDTAFLTCVVSAPPNTDYIYNWMFNGHKLNLENDPHYALGMVKYGENIRNFEYSKLFSLLHVYGLLTPGMINWWLLYSVLNSNICPCCNKCARL